MGRGTTFSELRPSSSLPNFAHSLMQKEKLRNKKRETLTLPQHLIDWFPNVFHQPVLYSFANILSAMCGLPLVVHVISDISIKVCIQQRLHVPLFQNTFESCQKEKQAK